jgi:hypothetical protein
MIESLIDFFKKDDSKRYLKETIIQPVGNIIYNEIYIYLWMLCLYHVFLIFFVLVNLYLLLRILPFLQNPNQIL